MKSIRYTASKLLLVSGVTHTLVACFKRQKVYDLSVQVKEQPYIK